MKMAVTYGFYNSIDGDRKYDAIQFSSVFDGIIADGVFRTIGDCFKVSAGEGMHVIVGTGRAWYNHTWTLNDANMNLEVPASHVLYNRIDTVVIEVNSALDTRANSIKIVSGEASNDPQPPALMHTDTLNQYALANITVPNEATEIPASSITNLVGTETTPFAYPVVNDDQLLIDEILRKFSEQFPTSAINMFYPVGAIYLTYGVATNPGTYIGGTWEQIDEGFIVSSGVTTTTSGVTLNANTSKLIYIWRRTA